MKSSLLIAAVAALWLPCQAAAQDAPFQGPRLQLDLAYDRVEANDANPDLPREFEAAYLGGTIGYDHMVTRGLLIGVEAGFGKPLSERQRVPLGSDALSIELGREWLAGVRIGTPVTPSTLIFATAGYSNAGSSVMYESVPGAGVDPEVIEGSEDGFAWGLESNRWSVDEPMCPQPSGPRNMATPATRTASIALRCGWGSASASEPPASFPPAPLADRAAQLQETRTT